MGQDEIHNSVIWYQEYGSGTILHFRPLLTSYRAGFSLVVENEDGTLSMRTQTQIVEVRFHLPGR